MRALALTLVMIAGFIGNVFAAGEAGLDPSALSRIETRRAAANQDTARINAVTNNSIKNLSLNRRMLIDHDKYVNVRLPEPGITNQAGSGRCWLYAGLNVFSPTAMAALGLKSFEFSQSYLAFWDKMEKANYFLEEIIRLRDRDPFDREFQIVVDEPFGDGGWWQYATDLIEKYGVVPKSVMPETKQSSSTGQINNLASTKLRAFAGELRTMAHGGATVEELRARKEEMLSDIYTLLVYAYGTPPKEFTFRYEKDSTVTEPKSYTPESFYKDVLGGHLPEVAVLMDNPVKGYDTLYQFEGSRNMADKEDLVVLNLPISKLKQYAFDALTDSEAVWFACDVGPYNYRDSGILEMNIYDYTATLGMDFSISKKDQIQYGNSDPNHAMTLIGVDTTSDGKPVKWLVENSWGDKGGDKGYWYMYDDWFDQYVYFVVVRQDRLLPEDQKKLKQKPVVLPMWEPFNQAFRHLN